MPEIDPSVTVTQDLPDDVRPETAHSVRGAALGRYLMLSRLGAGGMGVVYLAYDPDLDRRVAVKVLPGGGPSTDGGRLLREAQAMARLSHPNVISVFDVGFCDAGLFLAMEWVDGQTLAQWLRVPGGRPWSEVLNVFTAAGEGLSAAHAAGLIHRDFKPENVLVSTSGRVKVTDFGIALAVSARVEAPSGAETTARSGGTPGTPAFMSPEQHDGGEPDPRSDQFSFCVALYEGLFRQHPFHSDTKEGWRDACRKPQPPPLKSRVPPWVRQAVMRGMSADPAERFPSMDLLLASLGRNPSWRWVKPLAWAAALGVLVGVMGTREALVSSRAAACEAESRDLASTWSRQLRPRVANSNVGGAMKVVHVLDRYAAEAARMEREACVRVRVKQLASEDALAEQHRCLERRMAHLGALATRLSESAAPAGVALRAAVSLPPLSGCPSTTGPVRASRLLEVHYAVALGEAEAASRLAADATRSATGSTELLALAQLASADAARIAGRPSLELYREAALAASAARVDDAAAIAWLGVLEQTVELSAAGDEAAHAARMAEALITRAGGDEELEARLAEQRARIAERQGASSAAMLQLEHALALRERRWGGEHPVVADTLNRLAALHGALGDARAALAVNGRAVEILERWFGPESDQLLPALAARSRFLAGGESPEERARVEARAERIKELTTPR